MLYGVGNVFFTSIDFDASNSLRGQDVLIPGCIAAFEFSSETTSARARCFNSQGILQTAASQVTGETFVLNITFEFNNWTSLQLLYGELESQESGVMLPELRAATVDGSDEILDADITVSNASEVLVYNSTTKEFLIVVAGVPSSANEVQVDGALNKMVFFAGTSGDTIEYSLPITYSSVNAIGVAKDVDFLRRLTFNGILAGTEEGSQSFQLIIDEIVRTQTPTLNIAGDVATIAITYDCINQPGRRKPFALYQLSSAVV